MKSPSGCIQQARCKARVSTLPTMFHGLPDIDEKNRSCRKRLADHNERRRKPHKDQFNSRSTASSYYGTFI
nr:squamosa promoter-binding-like protein 12 [Tanacetum cinerariifolium]